MANISNMEMASKVVSLDSVSHNKGFLGMFSSYTYTPTGSKLSGRFVEYKTEVERQLLNILEGNQEETAKLPGGYLRTNAADLGTLRLDVCESADGNFYALQLFRYDQYVYKPVTDVKIFEGSAAAEIQRLF